MDNNANQQIEIELWVDVLGYEGLYEVSSEGRVRGVSRKTILTNDKRPYVSIAGKILKPMTDYKGYNYVFLYKDRIKKRMRIHRIVGISFIPNPMNKPIINHINSVRNDNRLINLEWVTDSENQKHAYSTGSRKGSCGNTRLKREEVVEIKILLSQGLTKKEISDRFCVTASNISRIARNKIWINI